MAHGIVLTVGGTVNSPNPFFSSGAYASTGYNYGILGTAYPHVPVPFWTVINSGVVNAVTGIGIELLNGGVVQNAGTITGGGSFGIYLLNGGTVTNAASGQPDAVINGEIKVIGAIGSVFNGGTIQGAIYFGAGGNVDNGAPESSGSAYEGPHTNALLSGPVMITTTSGVTVENYGRFGTGVNGGLSVSSVYTYDSYGNPVLSVVSVSNGLLGATGAYMAGVVITSATGIVTNQGTMGGWA